MMNKPKNRRSNSKSSKNTENNGTKKTPGNIRIIAGHWRGRKLPVHDVQGLRPTTDRVKETLFNWLMNQIHDSHCLDCFAGSGSLGFEALSRGAAQLLMLEKDPQAAKQLNDNVQLLKADNAQVVKADSLAYLQQLKAAQPFDLVFIDPPFRLNLAQQTCDLLENQQLLSENALIYVEVESELDNLNLPPSWQLLKQKTAGQVTYTLYQRHVSDE
jgi:16S rRNA (guanine966-N2)-methyltransferase